MTDMYSESLTWVKVAAAVFATGVIASLLVLGIRDLVLIFSGGLRGASASRVIADLARSEPIWAFLPALIGGFTLGVLTGHFVWPQWR
jgi:hypothetical protein